MTKYYYKYTSSDKWLLIEGIGDDPKDCDIVWSGSDGNEEDLSIIKNVTSIRSPKYGFIKSEHKKCKRNIYIQVLRINALLKKGYRCDDYDVPKLEMDDEDVDLTKMSKDQLRSMTARLMKKGLYKEKK